MKKKKQKLLLIVLNYEFNVFQTILRCKQTIIADAGKGENCVILLYDWIKNRENKKRGRHLFINKLKSNKEKRKKKTEKKFSSFDIPQIWWGHILDDDST